MSALCCTPFFLFVCLVLENRRQVHITAGSGETVCLWFVCIWFRVLYFSALSSYWATLPLLPLICVTVGPAHPLRVVATSVMPSTKKTKTSEVTGISTTDYQYVPEEFGDHHGKHDVWVAEIPFIGLKTFTCDTSGVCVVARVCELQCFTAYFSIFYFFVFARWPQAGWPEKMDLWAGGAERAGPTVVRRQEDPGRDPTGALGVPLHNEVHTVRHANQGIDTSGYASEIFMALVERKLQGARWRLGVRPVALTCSRWDLAQICSRLDLANQDVFPRQFDARSTWKYFWTASVVMMACLWWPNKSLPETQGPSLSVALRLGKTQHANRRTFWKKGQSAIIYDAYPLFAFAVCFRSVGVC